MQPFGYSSGIFPWKAYKAKENNKWAHREGDIRRRFCTCVNQIVPLSSWCLLNLPPSNRSNPEKGALELCGSAAYEPATRILPRPILIFVASTRSRMAYASEASSIFSRPLPSTSHKPDWATFHKPLSADLLIPSAKNRGNTTPKRTMWPIKSPSSTIIPAQPAYNIEIAAKILAASARRFRSSIPIFCFRHVELQV